MLGGYLVDLIGYRRTFLITAGLQMGSVLLYAPLLLLVAAERKPTCRGNNGDAVRAAEAPSSIAARAAVAAPPLETPLLLAQAETSTR